MGHLGVDFGSVRRTLAGMEHKVFRIGSLAFLVLLVIGIAKEKNLPDDSQNPLYLVLLYILAAVIVGILVVTWALPALGDKVSEAMIGSGEEAEETPTSKAVALMVAGDYEGAISEYARLSMANPEDRHPVVEMARLYHDKLDDPESAIQTLATALGSRSWKADDETFLTIRLADWLMEDRKDFAGARERLEHLQRKHAGEAPSFQAATKLREVDEAEYRARQK